MMTKSAERTAGILMNGSKAMETSYGNKTILGVASLITKESGLGNALIILKDCRNYFEEVLLVTDSEDDRIMLGKISDAIYKIEA